MSRLSARRNADGTITVRAGRYREHVTVAGRDPGDVIDAVRWAAITAGVPAETGTIQAMLADLDPLLRLARDNDAAR